MIFSRRRKRFTIPIVFVLAVLLVIVLGVYMLLNGIGRLGQFESLTPEQLATLFEEGATAELDAVFDQAETILKSDGITNILLVGQDRREGQGTQRTDAMILCTINTKTKTFTMTSFLRDLWVYVPNRYNQRMNVPYMLGGFPLLNDTLEYNFGVRADYNVEIDFSGFVNVIDAVGGVNVTLTGAEANYLNKNGSKKWGLTEGENLLTGTQALAFSRIRKIGMDFGRTNRQRAVLTALIEKTETLDITEIFEFAKQIMPQLRTDMTNTQILSVIFDVIPMLSDFEVVSQRIPMDGQYSFANKNGASVIAMTENQLKVNRELLAAAMNTD